MRTRLVLLGGQTVLLGLAIAFLVVPVSALFLDEYGAEALPYVYLAVAAAGVVVSSAMARAEHRLSLARLAARVVGFYLVAVAAGWLVLVALDGLWVLFPLLVLFPLSIPIGFVLVGSQAGRLLDVRQMKAHFPRVAAGFSVGFALGGLVAAGLVSPLGGPEPLLAVDVVVAGCMLGLVVATSRRFPDELRATPEPAAERRPSRRTSGWLGLLRNRMVAMILAYQLLSAAVTLLLDYMVWERAAVRYPDPTSLAEFMGVFGAIINVASVLFAVVLAGWLLTRFGIGFGLAANPVGVLVLLVMTTVVGYAVGPVAFMFFALVCAQQVTDIALTDGTTRTSINATYQALLPDQRVRAQTMVEGAGVPLALGCVGLLLIAQNALGLGILAVVVATLLLTVVWVGSAVLAFREYGVNLRAVLSRRAWDPVALRIDDAASYAAVEQLLRSPDPQDVHAALDALADTGRDVSEHVLLLLEDPDPVRRELGLEIAVDDGLLPVPAVVEQVGRLLVDPEPDVALAAAAALVGSDAGLREPARSAWLEAIASEDSVATNRALRGAAAFPHRFFVPYLVGLAASDRVNGDALDALDAHANYLATRVHGLLADPSVPRQTRQRVVHFLGRADTPQARDLLLAHLDDGDPAIVDAAAQSLVAVGHTVTPASVDLGPRLAAVADRVHRCLTVLLLLGDQPGHEPLRYALRDEVDAGASRAEVLLSLVHDPRAIRTAVADLASASERTRSTALEMLEVTVGRQLGKTTLALIDPTLDDNTRQGLLGDRPARTLADCLRELVLDEDGYWHDPWLRACALYAVPTELPDHEARGLTSRYLDDEDRDVVETARWMEQRLTPDRARE